MSAEESARLRELEIRLEKLEKKAFAMAFLANETTKALNANSKRDEELRALVADQKEAKRSYIRIVGLLAILGGFYVANQLQAQNVVDAILVVGTSAGWWVIKK